MNPINLRLSQKELTIIDYYTFNQNHKCIKWTDYELLLHELEAANELPIVTK